MPAQLEACVSGMLAKWRKNPKDRPEPKKSKSGKPQTARSQAFAICTASLQKAGKLETVDLVSLEGVGPTVLGAAATNRPHIKGLPPISIVEEDGKEKLLVPLLRQGHYKHSSGLLEFNDTVFANMVGNYKEGVVGNDISLDNRHKPELGALGWFEDLYVDDNGILTAKVGPTSVGLDTIKDKRYRYASIEFHRDWESPEVKFTSESIEYLEDFSKEDIVMDDEKVTQLEQQNQELMSGKVALEQKIASLEAAQAAREKEIAKLEERVIAERVRGIILEAESYRDENGLAHPKALIDWARKILAFEKFEDGSDVVSLEEGYTSGDVKAYTRKAVVSLLKTLPGTVPLESDESDRLEHRMGDDNPDGEYTNEETQSFKDFWEM